MHATVSGCGDNLATDDEDAIEQAKATVHVLSPTGPRTRRATRRSEPAMDLSPPTWCPRRSPGVRHAPRHRLPGRRRVLLRGQAALAAGADRRPRPARRPPRRVVANNPAAKGGVLFVDSADKAARFIWCATRSTSRWSSSPTCPASWSAPRSSGRDHPSRGEDDHRGVRGDRAQGLGDRAQGVRRRPLRHVRARLRARGDDRPADRPDRGHGPRGGGERGVRQQDRRHRRPRRARGVHRRGERRSTRTTSTFCAWRRELVVDGWSTSARLGRDPGGWSEPGRRSGTSASAATACPRSRGQSDALVRRLRAY